MANIEFNMNNRYRWTIPDVPYVVKTDNKITTDIPSNVDIAFDRHFVDTTVRGLVESYQTCVAIYTEMKQLSNNPPSDSKGRNYWDSGTPKYRQNQEDNIDKDHANKMNFTNPKPSTNTGIQTRIIDLNNLLNSEYVNGDTLENILDFYNRYTPSIGNNATSITERITLNAEAINPPAAVTVDAFRDANGNTKFPARTDGQSYNQPIKLEWFARLRENLINTSNFFIKNNGKFYDVNGHCIIGCQVNCQSTCQLTCQHRQLGDDFLKLTFLADQNNTHREYVTKLGWETYVHSDHDHNIFIFFYDPWGRRWMYRNKYRGNEDGYYLLRDQNDTNSIPRTHHADNNTNLEWYPGAPYDNPKKYHWEMRYNRKTGNTDLVNTLDPNFNSDGEYNVYNGWADCSGCENK